MRSVAEHLGVNFVEVFGSVLAGFGGPTSGTAADRTVEARIRTVFDRAAEHAPCILYLRRFEQACRSSGQSSNEIKGQASKIADLLQQSLVYGVQQVRFFDPL